MCCYLQRVAIYYDRGCSLLDFHEMVIQSYAECEAAYLKKISGNANSDNCECHLILCLLSQYDSY